MLVNYEYDYLKRPDKITYISGDYIIRSEEFGYTTQGTTNGALPGMIESYTSSVSSNTTTYVYSYDSRGNITTIVVGDKEIRYTYDDLGQLLREENELLNQSFTYTYDNAGNIKSKKVCNLTTGVVASNQQYSYSSSAWGDRLTAFGSTGNITYDAIGNPLTYNNGTTYHFTWEGRNLTRVYTSGYATHFTYNSDGIRTARYSDNGSRTEFILNGSQILAEVSEDSVIAYIYDANGSPIGMQHRLTTYAEDVWDIFWFDKNLHGDIVAVYNENGTKCISYIYDAWGKSVVTIHDQTGTNQYAIQNSFRYRGYYYDRTISMYYLNSRYYDPITCRFINADRYVSTGQGILGNNMYAYCENNPVNYVDYTGNKPGDLFDTADDAALDFAMCYNELSIADMQEYGSAIYVVTTISITYVEAPWYLLLLGIKCIPKIIVTKKYSYTEPSIGKNGNSVTPNFLTMNPIVSTIHTHANYDPYYDNENFSTGFGSDIGWSNFFHMDSYVVTPGGYLKKYTYANRNDANGGISEISNTIPWDPNSPDH